MKASELRSKDTNELQKELAALFQEQFNLRIQKGVGQTQQPNLMRKVKKNIARIKTVLREKEGS